MYGADHEREGRLTCGDDHPTTGGTTSALAEIAGKPYTPFVVRPALQVQGPVPEL
jgi:hypothetical protein